MNDNKHIELWEKCLAIIKDNIPEEQYNIWFRNITSCGFSNNVLRLYVPSPFFVEQLEERYLTILVPTLRRVYGNEVELWYNFNQVKNQPDTLIEQSSAKPSTKIQDMERTMPAPDPFRNPVQTELNPQLNPRYTFENYCHGESNKIVRSIAEAISNDPSNHTFNPLFIFGPVGVGKTHLIQAIGIRIKEKNPRSRVLYVTARQFESQYTAAAKKDINSFFHFYQSIDTLIIDDVQDLHDKPRTQNTFFYIFNHLHQNNKQIIMSSDRAPVAMEGFEDRLLSRFKWGMAAEIERPDIDLRRRVLSQKAALEGVNLSADVREFIAANVTNSIRDLEGVMVSLLGHATMLNVPIDIDLARAVVSKTVKITTKPVNFESLTQEVCAYYNLAPDVIFTKSRKREIADARQIVMYLAKKVAKLSLVEIGRMLDRTHATVNHGCNLIEERISADRRLADDIRKIESVFA